MDLYTLGEQKCALYAVIPDNDQTAKVLYAVLLDRANLSRVNGWTDEDGNIYIVFPLNKIADLVDKGPSTVKNALNELETAGMIERRRCGNGMPNRIYVKQPDSQEIDRLMDKKLAVRGPENWPADSQKVGRQIAKKLAPNKIGSSNLKNNLSRVSDSAPARGRYQNVFLLDTEITELQRQRQMPADETRPFLRPELGYHADGEHRLSAVGRRWHWQKLLCGMYHKCADGA